MVRRAGKQSSIDMRLDYRYSLLPNGLDQVIIGIHLAGVETSSMDHRRDARLAGAWASHSSPDRQPFQGWPSTMYEVSMGMPVRWTI